MEDRKGGRGYLRSEDKQGDVFGCLVDDFMQCKVDSFYKIKTTCPTKQEKEPLHFNSKVFGILEGRIPITSR